MSNGDKKDEKTKKTTAEKIGAVGDVVSNLGKTIETLFGPPQSAPQQQIPSVVRTGPPAVASPPPGFSTVGAGGGSLPQAPAGVMSPQPRPVAPYGLSGPPGGGTGGVIAANAMSSIFGAVSDIANTKKQEKIQHAQFLYHLLDLAYSKGDEKTMNTILQDDQNRQLIEKYLTGKIPRVPGKPVRSDPLYAPRRPGESTMEQRGSLDLPTNKGIGDIGKPGGPALPRPSPQEQTAAAVNNMILEGLKRGDPRIVDKLLGEGTASLSQEQYSQAMRSKFGIELSPAQVEAMDKQAQLALSETKADVMKYLVGQQMMADRAIAVAKVHAGATVDKALVDERSRLEVAKKHSDLLIKLKDTAPDKMEQLMYKLSFELYSKMAENSAASSGRLAKDDPKIAKQYDDEAKQWALKADEMKKSYEAGQFLDKILGEEKKSLSITPDTSIQRETPTPKEDDNE